MGFYFRKSFKLVPIRFKLSKSGVGVSAGVKGARVGIDAKGKKYIHVGRGGIYHRQTLKKGLDEEVTSQGLGIGWHALLVILAALLILYWTANP